MMPWGYHLDGGMWFAMILNGLFWIIIVVLLIVLAVRLFRGGPMRYDGWGQHPDNAEEILHRRLANGEIEVEEYEKRMNALRAQRPPR
jgi:uncharacterized membrane protein